MSHRLLHAIRALAIIVLLGPGLYPTVANAQYGARDNGNGASILVPYFEVDLDDPASANTVVTVRNASATAVLAHYTIWSDWGVPLLSFQAYMTGYDVVHTNLRSLLVDGNITRTASAGQDPQDTISNKGQYSQDINFASCNGILPYPAAVLTTATRASLRAELTGERSTLRYAGRCVGSNQGDGRARGYITIDTVNACSNLLPTEVPYQAAYVTGQSVLGGEYLLYGDGGALIHQAPVTTLQSSFPTSPGDYTFYGRLSGYTAPGSSDREPLNGAWAVDTGGQDAELIVWRDQQRNAAFNGTASCGTSPAPFPLADGGILHFGVDTTVTAGTMTVPLATQRIRLRAAEPALATAKLGWSFLNLNTVPMPANGPPAAPGANQALVEVIQYPERAGATPGSGVALPLDTGNAPYLLPSPP